MKRKYKLFLRQLKTFAECKRKEASKRENNRQSDEKTYFKIEFINKTTLYRH